jgi:hypothetical protein
MGSPVHAALSRAFFLKLYHIDRQKAIVSGRRGGLLDPRGNASRAEAAQRGRKYIVISE